MVTYLGILTVRDGMRQAYIDELKEAMILDEFRNQRGNVFYSISAIVENNNQLVIADGWQTKQDFASHDSSDVVREKWRPLYKKYVLGEESYLLHD